MQKRASLLQINTIVNSGSHGRIAEELGLMVMENGWASYIAYGRKTRPSQSELIKIGNNRDIYLHGLQTRLFDRHGLGSKGATQKLIRQIQDINPSIIHLQNIHGYYLNIEVLFHYLAHINTPVVWTFHDCWPFTGHCTHFDFVGCMKWKTECFNCPQKAEYPSSLLFDRSRKNYTLKRKLFTSVRNLHIVTVSNWLKEVVQKSFFSDFPIALINNGIDTNDFAPIENPTLRVKYNLGNKFVILGVASVWSIRKGLNLFLELNEMLDNNFSIVLVGLNANQIRNLPDSITAIPHTESLQELAGLYSLADIYLNPSVEETFGLTTVEAMACGTPAIVFNCTASPEVITTQTGFVVEKGNLQSVIDCIKKVKQEGKSKFSAHCIERVKNFYNKTDSYRHYFELYESLLK